MDESFKQTLIDYTLSGHAYLHAPTPEKARFLADLKEIGQFTSGVRGLLLHGGNVL